MTLSAWLDVATPHRTLQTDRSDESLFAADLGLVAEGRGPQTTSTPDVRCEDLPDRQPQGALVEIGNRWLTTGRGSTGIRRVPVGVRPTPCSSHSTASARREKVRSTNSDGTGRPLKAKALPKAESRSSSWSGTFAPTLEGRDSVVLHNYLGHLPGGSGAGSSMRKCEPRDEGAAREPLLLAPWSCLTPPLRGLILLTRRWST